MKKKQNNSKDGETIRFKFLDDLVNFETIFKNREVEELKKKTKDELISIYLELKVKTKQLEDQVNSQKYMADALVLAIKTEVDSRVGLSFSSSEGTLSGLITDNISDRISEENKLKSDAYDFIEKVNRYKKLGVECNIISGVNPFNMKRETLEKSNESLNRIIERERICRRANNDTLTKILNDFPKMKKKFEKYFKNELLS